MNEPTKPTNEAPCDSPDIETLIEHPVAEALRTLGNLAEQEDEPWRLGKKGPPNMVTAPAHYTGRTGVECIEAVESALTEEEYHGYLKGTLLVYNWRLGLKGNRDDEIKDAKKMQQYLHFLIRELER